MAGERRVRSNASAMDQFGGDVVENRVPILSFMGITPMTWDDASKLCLVGTMSSQSEQDNIA